MKTPITPQLNRASRRPAGLGLVIGLLTFTARVEAFEDPPGCSLANGGSGSSYQSRLHVTVTEAHLGDSVPLIPMFGMAPGACRAFHVNGSAHIATGKLADYLKDATFDPGILVVAPARPFEPGPYSLLITKELVGAGVSSSKFRFAGVPNTVQVVANFVGEAQTGGVAGEQFGSSHTVTINIVRPELQVIQQFVFPPGKTCFPGDQLIECTGYVTNSGDITLTNVTARDRGDGVVQLFNQTNGSAFPGNVILPPGACAMFTNRFLPTAQEIATGRATNLITATARDTTTIGGPNALVANSITSSCDICDDSNLPSPLAATLTEATYTANREFQCEVTGQAGVRYVMQATTDLNSNNWLSLGTNTAPFTFVDSEAALHPVRFYRALALPEP